MGSDLRVIVDHLSGSRRGQRDEVDAAERIRLGRHPDSEIRFDARRDLAVSTRHAELRRGGDGYVFCDVGSSNGTLVGGERISERELACGSALVVQLGDRGPRLQIFVAGAEHPEPPDPPLELPRATRAHALITVLVALVLALVLSALIWAR